MNDRIGKEAVMVYSESLSWHLSGRTEDNHEKLSIQSVFRPDSHRILPEHKSEASRLETAFSGYPIGNGRQAALHIILRSRMCGVLPPLPFHHFIAWYLDITITVFFCKYLDKVMCSFSVLRYFQAQT